MKYEIGDIIWVAEFEDINKKVIDHHYFVVIDDDGKLIPADYFGFVVSSNISKSKENSKFKYNETIKKNNHNKLKNPVKNHLGRSTHEPESIILLDILHRCQCR